MHGPGKLETRFVILTNELPRLTDASGALASRFITLVLTESFYGREDLGLTDKLAGELPGILNWALGVGIAYGSAATSCRRLRPMRRRQSLKTWAARSAPSSATAAS